MSEVQGRGPVVRVVPRVLGASVVTLAGGSLFVGAQPVQAAAFTVTNTNDSGAGSLRQAILDAEASSGADTITITATGTLTMNSVQFGVYVGAGFYRSFTEDLTIVGPGSGSFTIDANGECDPFFVYYTEAGVDLSISGITITDAYCDAIDLNSDGGSLTLDDVVITYSDSSGVELYGLASVTITDSTFENNNKGIQADSTSGAVSVSNSTLDDNRDAGLYVAGAGAVTVTDVTAFFNGTYGVDVRYASSLTVSGLTASGNSNDGLNVYQTPTVSISDSTFDGNGLDGIDVYAATVELSVSDVVSVNNDYDGIEFDSDASWSDLVSISDSTFDDNYYTGINGDDVDVLTITNVTASNNRYYGVYIEGIGEATVTSSTFSDNGYEGLKLTLIETSVSLVDVTVESNYDYGVVIEDSPYAAVTVTGLVASYNDDGGLYVDGAGSVLVEDSVFTSNFNEDIEIDDVGGDVTVRNVMSTDAGGGGLYVYNVTGNVLVENSTFVGSDGEFYVTYVDGDVTIRDVEVSGTIADDGMQIDTVLGAVLLERVTIADATYNGLFIEDASVTVSNSTITGSGYSGVQVDSGGVTIEHSTITGNARYGVVATGGFYQYQPSPMDSLGSPQSYVFVPVAADLTVDHSIVSGNGYADVLNESDSNAAPDQGTTTVSWSLVDEGSEHAGGSNTEADDPKLGALADNGGATRTMLPADDSPVLSAGDPAISGAPEFDQRGVTRVVNRIEIGAVESELNQGVLAVEVPESVSEDDDGITLVVSRTGGTDGAVSATLRSCDGTELTVSWADGESADQTVTFPVPEGFAGQDCEIEVVSATGGLALGEVASFPVPVTPAAVPTTTVPTTPTTTTIPTPVTLPPTGGGSQSGVVAWLAAALVGVGGVFARTTRRRRTS